MNLFGWFNKKKAATNGALRQWRDEWAAAVEGDETADEGLRRQLEELARIEADVELEQEMLDALEQLRAAQQASASGTLPTVETHHRVIAAETCHFSAPASLASDGSQASGRVLLTRSRAVFVGTGRTSATAWHMVRNVGRTERDVFFVRGDGSPVAHFRFNTFGDAVVCAFLAKRLKSERPPTIIGG